MRSQQKLKKCPAVYGRATLTDPILVHLNPYTIFDFIGNHNLPYYFFPEGGVGLLTTYLRYHITHSPD
jgi:hypothetical protein